MNEREMKLTIRLEDALLLFKDLEEYVVSFDRIISRLGAGADPEILVDYLMDRRVYPRLAQARRIMADLVESAIGAEKLEAIAEDVFAYSDDFGRE
jgi:hypothetical protein